MNDTPPPIPHGPWWTALLPARLTFRGFVTLVVLGGFFWAFGENPHDAEMKAVIANLAVAAVAYWLGSSHGAKENRETLDAELAAKRATGGQP